MATLRRLRNLIPSQTNLVSSQLSTSQCSKSQHPPLPTRPVIGILGAGISGLSAAFYITKKFGDRVQTVVFEEQNRVGGWIHTIKGENGGMYEMGPRTVRPFGIRGLNTLDLVEEIGLDTELFYVDKKHDAARDRFIWIRGELVKLPGDYSVLYKRAKPFSKPLVTALIRDLVAAKKTLPDDSIYNFVSRRFGPEIAEYLTDPLIRGICAGDSKRISVKFIMKQLFELEQTHRSVLLGTLREQLSKKKKCSLRDDDRGIGFSKVAAASKIQNWAVWGLERGIGSLPEKLHERLSGEGVQFKLGCRVEGLEGRGKGMRVAYSLGGRSDVIECDHVVSSVGSNVLGRVLRGSTGVAGKDIVDELSSINYEDLQVTGIRFKGDVLQKRGFGFLVPSCEKSVGGLLGVVFDTNCFPQGDDTVITVMSRGDGGEESRETLLGYVRQTLGIEQQPSEVCGRVLRSCIPQYEVGHYERVGRVVDGLGRLGVCGAWVDGVSVNDCVYGGRGVARGLGDLIGDADVESERMRANQ